ncbi:MAG: hypothetical protein K8I03_14625 [Ignavibacteria bacterium]|nr:hypothetical protein [Ignavibacteria bacterium]
MSFQNFITEEDLRSYIPELSKLLWTDEANFDRQKKESEKLFLNDLADRGYRGTDIMPELMLRNSGLNISANETTEPSKEDVIPRQRFLLNVSKFVSGGSKIIFLEGSNDKSVWETVHTENPSGIMNSNVIISKHYRFYRIRAVVSGGSMDFKAYLSETTYERMLIYKWLELILLDRYSQENDQYHLKMKYFKSEYDRLWNTVKIYIDSNYDGATDAGEAGKLTTITILK